MTTFTIKPEIRQEIAEAIVKQSHPGYDTRYYGEYYAVDTDGDNELDAVMFKGATAQWEPWSGGDAAIAVSDFYQDSGADFDPSPDPVRFPPTPLQIEQREQCGRATGSRQAARRP